MATYETTSTRTRSTLLKTNKRGGHCSEWQASACQVGKLTAAVKKQTNVSGALSWTVRMLKTIILIGGPMKGTLSNITSVVYFPRSSVL